MSVAVERGRVAAAGPSTGSILGQADWPGRGPASFTQERLWFVSRLYAGSSVYNSSTVLNLRGPLDVSALEFAVNALRERHAVTRTSFETTPDGLMQVIAPFSPTALALVDLQSVPHTDREAVAMDRAGAFHRQPFDLDHGPLFATELLQLEPERHLLLVACHHTIWDGWSKGVLVRDLSELYEAAVQDRPPDLPAMPVQYYDYALWQRQHLQGERLEELLAFWREELAGVVPLELSTDFPRPPIRTTVGGYVHYLLPTDLTAAVKAVSRNHRATLYTTLVSAMQVLLHRYTDQDDLTIGFPIAGRTHVEVEPLLGPLINTLVLRADLSGNPTFEDFLGRQRQRVLQAMAHQTMPFEKLVHDLNVTRAPSRSPLFQVMMQLRNYPGGELLNKGGVLWNTMRPLRGTAQFDLSFAASEKLGQLLFNVEYNSDLFRQDTVERLMQHYETLLRGVVADPTRRLSDLPLLSEPERRQLLVDWNQTAGDYRQVCLHDLVVEQCQRHPDAAAAVTADQRLTYGELERQSERLAQRLRQLGCGPGSRVGLYLDRSLDIPVAFLGALRAGAACVPLDPNYPLKRLLFVADDAGVSLILTSDSVHDRLQGATQPVVRLSEALAHEPTTSDPLPSVSPDEIAYVTYTSGSTGQPKGVAVPHRGCVSLLTNVPEVFNAETTAGMLAAPSIAFDACLRTLLAPLVSGGCVVITNNLLDLVLAETPAPVTMVSTVPSAMAEILRHGKLPDSIETILFIGEPLPGELVRRLYRESNVRRIFNQYGPTETTWYCLQSPVGADCDDHPPLGRPVANMKMYVLDKYGNPVPQGVRGELFIGGLGVAPGYVNRPELTAERFLPDPFADDPAARMYRTGDVVRYDPEGNLHFVGRTDFQVKVRGCRVELPEVEATTLQHPGVQQAVVVTQAETPERLRLVAYVSPREGQALVPQELRDFMAPLVPEYMVPSIFMILPALPLKANGKVDRQALPEPQIILDERRETRPQTDLERQLLDLWTETLEIPNMGVEDSFFDLGGHSLLAARLFALMRERLGLSPPLHLLFDAPTVRAFAGLLTRDQADAETGGAPA